MEDLRVVSGDYVPFVWEDYDIPFPKPGTPTEHSSYIASGGRIEYFFSKSDDITNFHAALEEEGWILCGGSIEPFSMPTYAKDNQILDFNDGSVAYRAGDNGPVGPGSVTRAEALPIVQAAIDAQPYYIGPGVIRDEPRAEFLVETYIPGVFGSAQMQIFEAFGSADYSSGLNGRLGFFLVSNGTAIRHRSNITNGNITNPVVTNIDGDSVFELITLNWPDLNTHVVQIRAYKYGTPRGEDKPRVHLAYETQLDYSAMFASHVFTTLKLDRGRRFPLNGSFSNTRMYGVSGDLYVADLGSLVFEKGKIFPEKMEEYEITFSNERFHDRFNPPAD
jgi:hypothetical protein